MKIENARYESDGPRGYYALRFEVQGRTYSINPELKPGILSQGQAYFNGSLSNDVGLLRLSTAFLLEGYHGRTKAGPAVLTPVLAELRELGDRLSALLPGAWDAEGWIRLFTDES
jgi:hypothetical protein